MNELLRMYWIFFRMGCVAFGGGYTLLPILRREIVRKQGWVSEEQVMDFYAVSQGLPGIIAHGLCTMAFTSWAVLTEVAGSDVARLRRFAVRFSKMVLPGDDLETRIWAAGSADGATGYAFETARVGTDEFAITDGLAVIAGEN